MPVLPFFQDGQVFYSMDNVKSDGVKPTEYRVTKVLVDAIRNDTIAYEMSCNNRYYRRLTWDEKHIVERIKNGWLFDNKNDVLRKLIEMHENEKDRAKREYDYQVEKHDKKIALITAQIV